MKFSRKISWNQRFQFRNLLHLTGHRVRVSRHEITRIFSRIAFFCVDIGHKHITHKPSNWVVCKLLTDSRGVSLHPQITSASHAQGKQPIWTASTSPPLGKYQPQHNHQFNSFLAGSLGSQNRVANTNHQHQSSASQTSDRVYVATTF